MTGSFCRLISLTLLVFHATLINHSFQVTNPATHSRRKEIHNRFLVSLDSKNKQALPELEAKLRSLGIQYTLNADLTQVPDVFYGASIQLAETKHVRLLSEFEGVQNIKPVNLVTPGITHNSKILSRPLTSTTDKFPPHLQTRINLLHNQGIFGKGIKVALIDNGIDCEHLAFGGTFGKGRLSFGRSFVDDEGHLLPQNPVTNPCAKCSRHGTHTAGIVGAGDLGFGFEGVAPNVTLGMYRVFGCQTGTTDDLVMAALIQAHQDGADIISASLGQPGGWGEGTDILNTVNRLVELRGAIIIFSAGNSGSDGLFAASAPASARAAISVGSVDSSSPNPRPFQTSKGTLINYYKNEILPDKSYAVHITSKDLNDENDACFPLPSSTPNLSDLAVLIKVGGCFSSEKVAHAKAKGAKLILFYMKSRIVVSMRGQILNTTVATISFPAAKSIADEFKENPTGFRITFSKPKDIPDLELKPGFLSPFSEYGPSFDFGSPQPALSGIGGNVLSTFPMADGEFCFLSGTSMAAPQIAGIAALVLSHRGKKNFNGLTMRARLATSTRIVKSSEVDRRPETVAHQGGGLVDAFCAVFANTTVSTASLALADSSSTKLSQKVEVVNSGSKPVHYNVAHIPARSVQTFSNKEKYNRPDVTPDEAKQVATATITPKTFTLAPGNKQSITVEFRAPPIRNKDLLVLYSGFIILDADLECETHNIPYYGVVGSLKEQEVIDRGPVNGLKSVNYPYLAFEYTQTAKNENPSFIVLQKQFEWKLKVNNLLFLRMRALFGSPLLLIDVIDANSKGHLSRRGQNKKKNEVFRGVELIGRIPDQQFRSLPRSPADDFYSKFWDGNIVNSSHPNPFPLEDGMYKLLMRALRVNGDEAVESDYEFWSSIPFRLSR